MSLEIPVDVWMVDSGRKCEFWGLKIMREHKEKNISSEDIDINIYLEWVVCWKVYI